LAPEQVAVLPISEKFEDYAQTLVEMLRKHDIRPVIDLRDEKIGRKIRDAELQKTPYMLVIGEKEVQQQLVSVRKHGEGDQGTESFDAFLSRIRAEIDAISYN
jgi:threonyl-tRNA synthetase